jgi:hypothetical protein
VAVTEGEWLACTHPLKMLEFLRRKASGRQLRLFSAAHARWLAGRLAPKECDGLLKAAALAEQWADTREQPPDADSKYITLKVHPWRSASMTAGRVFAGDPSHDPSRDRKVGLIRDIFGNLIHPVSFAPAVLSWHDATVVRLAQAAYDERHMPEGTLDNGRLAILADALEEAGCSDFDILNHCRRPGEHVRGCWVVDIILGKE